MISVCVCVYTYATATQSHFMFPKIAVKVDESLIQKELAFAYASDRRFATTHRGRSVSASAWIDRAIRMTTTDNTD